MQLKKIIASVLVSLLILQPVSVVLADTVTPDSNPAPAPAADVTAPSVGITTPAGGTSLRGTVTISADASDDTGVTKVVFYNGPNVIGESTAVPASLAWDTATVANNLDYMLSAKAYDAAGNVGTSAPVTVHVQNIGKIPDYAYNDATHKWEPTITSSFTWDPATGYWMSPFYTYASSNGWYHVKPQVTPSEAVNSLTAGSADPAATLGQILGNDPSNTNTGPNSVNNASLNNQNQLLANLINNIGVTNNMTSNATSGAADVSGNTNGGSATSGAASVVMNLLNLLNAMWSWNGGGLNYFIHNIWGNQTGDVNLNTGNIPAGGCTSGGCGGQLGVCAGGADSNSTTGPNSINNATSTCQDGITVNNKTNGSIVNNVDLGATTGAASVTGNTNGGSATSGDARAELNIVNLINSAIGAGQSFFGMLNIYGNLNGDILFPGLGLNAAFGSGTGGSSVGNSNTGPNSTNNATANNTNNVTVNNSVCAGSNQVTEGPQGPGQCGINNNVNATALSGNASVDGNTRAGSATSGQADTNTSTFNLFNTNVFGDNAVLVLINDMGHWVGRIMNLGGDGSIGGLLTSGATVQNANTGPNSTNNASATNANNTNVNNSFNGSITNNVNANATSGNATVANNNVGGDATSGDATVTSNIANILGSHLSFKHVFGILMINVFGSWVGSVGVDTAAGNTPQPVSATTTTTNGPATVQNHFTSQSSAGNGSGIAGNTSVVHSSTNNIGVKTLAAKQSYDTAAAKASRSLWPYIIMVISGLALLLAAGMSTLEKRLAPKA